MTTMQFNNQTVELKPQENGPFLHLAGNMIPALSAGEPFAKICCHILSEGMKQNAPTDHPLMQCAMWMLYQVGVRTITIDLEKEEVNMGQPEKTSLEGVPFGEHFTPGNAATGRAVVATLMLITSRSVRVNGEEWPVRPQPLETMKRVNAEVVQSRKFNEEHHITATRRLLSLLLAGKTKDDPEVLASLQVMADLHVRSFRYTADGSQVVFEAFNEPNALAMAYMHNMDPAQTQNMLQRVHAMNMRCQQGAAGVPPTNAPVNRRRRN